MFLKIKFYLLRNFYVFKLEFLNDNNKKNFIDQAKKSSNREIVFQFLLAETQVFNQEIIKFNSNDYERFNSTLKVSSDFSEDDDKACDNEFTIFMSYFDLAITTISNENDAFDLVSLNFKANDCENAPTYRYCQNVRNLKNNIEEKYNSKTTELE